MKFIGTNGLFSDKFKSSREKKSDKEKKTSDKQMCQRVNSRMRKEEESQASFKVCVLLAVSVVAVEKKVGPQTWAPPLGGGKVRCTKHL